MKTEPDVKLLNSEVKSIIAEDVDKLLDKVVEALHLQACEEHGFNNPEFSEYLDKITEQAQEYLIYHITGEVNE